MYKEKSNFATNKESEPVADIPLTTSPRSRRRGGISWSVVKMINVVIVKHWIVHFVIEENWERPRHTRKVELL